MQLTEDNAFMGAVVTNGTKTVTVYKVNSKTFYGGQHTLNQYKDLLEHKYKGETFKSFCSSNNIEQFSYSGWEITEEEAAKKSIAAEATKSQKVLDKGIRKEIKNLYEDSIKRNYSLRLKYTQYLNDIIRVICNSNDCLLITVDGGKYLYCVSTEETVKLAPEELTFTEKTVPWNKLLSYKAA